MEPPSAGAGEGRRAEGPSPGVFVGARWWHMSSVGLVLGAGGVVGQAYHAGVLAVLEHDCGWDPRRADVIVGTSAGSITGTLLRAGVPASELAAWAVKAPLSAEGRVLHDILGTEWPEFEPFRPWSLLRPPDLPGWDMLQQAVRRPLSFRPLVAALSLLAPGRLDIASRLAVLAEVEGQSWPERDLWICAVRRRDGRRVVFGRPGTPEVPLHLAIAASCAIPGYFAPVPSPTRRTSTAARTRRPTPRSCASATWTS